MRLDVFTWVEILTFRNVHHSMIMIQLMHFAREIRENLLQPAIKNHQSPADNTNSIASRTLSQPCIHYFSRFNVIFYRSYFNLITLNNRTLTAMNVKLYEIIGNCISMHLRKNRMKLNKRVESSRSFVETQRIEQHRLKLLICKLPLFMFAEYCIYCTCRGERKTVDFNGLF